MQENESERKKEPEIPHQSHCEAFLAVFLQLLEHFFQILQKYNIFVSYMLKSRLLHAYETKFMDIFSLFTNNEFFQKVPVKSQILIHI